MNALDELKANLTEEEVDFVLNEAIAFDYKSMILNSKYPLADTLDLEELLGEYIQLKGIENSELNEHGLKAENILNKLESVL